jgi:hypothetical protein
MWRRIPAQLHDSRAMGIKTCVAESTGVRPNKLNLKGVTK